MIKLIRLLFPRRFKITVEIQTEKNQFGMAFEYDVRAHTKNKAKLKAFKKALNVVDSDIMSMHVIDVKIK